MFEDPRDLAPKPKTPRSSLPLTPLMFVAGLALGAVAAWLALSTTSHKRHPDGSTEEVCLAYIDQFAKGAELAFDESWEDNGPHRFDLMLEAPGQPKVSAELCVADGAGGALRALPRTAAAP